ncbi:cell division control protein 7 [Cryptococcus neoformans Bt63]|nr:cell division control protein 7 [Cryptococcus neoformans var. grubii Bt63]
MEEQPTLDPFTSQPPLTRAAAKRLATASPSKPSPARSAKRVREATPIVADDGYSTPRATTVTPMKGMKELRERADEQGEACPNAHLTMGSIDVNTSEAESVLFSEKTTVLQNEEVEGTVETDGSASQSLSVMTGDVGRHTYRDDFTRGEQDLFMPEATSTSTHRYTTKDRITMPPPTDVPSHKLRSSSLYDPFTAPAAEGTKLDRMTEVLEKQKKRSFTEMDVSEFPLEEEWDEEGEAGDPYSDESYHSGDTEDYEMDHRPVLQRTAVKKDIRDFTNSLSLLRDGSIHGIPYKVVDRLGEGTFSSVYLAYDSLHHLHSNEYWLGQKDGANQIPDKHAVRVALKKILVTSSAIRIENELAILEDLRGCRNVSQLITAFREEDQVIIVLPYHQCDDFRHFFKHMDPHHMRSYMRDLFRSLKDIHQRGIIHRDVKPANFLYDYESETGVLVDFGLAERYCPPQEATCQHAPATSTSLQGFKIKTPDTSAVEQAVYDARKRSKLGEGRVGFPHEDKRPAIRTNRAGTRGFRAPEVLLKCPDQTVAVDVWSAGIILFSILTQKFPAFNSSDDIEALMEIAAIFGKTAMERCALLHNRTMISNVPTLDDPPSSLTELILTLNPHLYTPHSSSPTPEEAKEHIEAVDDALDLVTKLLRLDCTKRLTAAQALRHPFVTGRDGEWDEYDDEEVLSSKREAECW